MATQAKPTAPAPRQRKPETTRRPGALSAVPKPEPRPGLDLGALLEHTAGQRAFSTVSEMFQSVSEGDLELLATFVKILSRNTGITTPAEEFVWGVVLTYGVRDRAGRGLTPEDIEDDLKMFRENFERMVDNHAFICERYGAEIHPAKQAEPQTAA